MKSLLSIFTGALIATQALPARAVLDVLACEPEWAALVRELAGDRVRVASATTARQDVHRIEARPSLVAAARRADLLVCTGADLEVGWLPVLVRESGNAKIRPGAPGSFEAAQHVPLIEVPVRVDRSEGDVHPQGNPHLQIDPHNVARVASALAQRLQTIDPGNAAFYRERQRAFDARWREAIARWERAAAPLRGLRVIVQHNEFGYLFRWLGIETAGALEPKPGVEPTPGHLAALLKENAARPAKFILRGSYKDPRGAAWFSGKSGLPVVAVPLTVDRIDAPDALITWVDQLIDALLKAARGDGR